MTHLTPTSEQRVSMAFLQIVIIFIGMSVFTLMLLEPHFEGRNVNATLFEIYFKDPFLAYVYISSTAFFIALYQAFTLVSYIRRNETFSARSIQAVRTIQRCALALVGLIIGAEAYIVISMGGKDDIAGGVAMGLFALFVCIVVAAVASVIELTLQSKTESN